MRRANVTLVELVASYVALQRALVETLKRNFPVDLHDYPWKWPQSGVIEVDNQRWRFSRHGAGYTFRDESTGRSVNAHEYLDTPSVFDAFRLETYLESLGEAARASFEHGAKVSAEMKGLDVALSALVQQGTLAIDPRTETLTYRSYTAANVVPPPDKASST